MSKPEQQFGRYLESQGKTWIFEPCKLDTGIPCKKHKRNQTYTPDFWCPEDKCYYEVSATRQAKSLSQRKIDLVKSNDPVVVIKIVNPCGTVYSQPLKKSDQFFLSAKEIKQIRINLSLTALEMSKLLGVNVSNIRYWENGRHMPTKKSLLQIIKLKNNPPVIDKPITPAQIKSLRLRLNLSQKEMAEILGVTPPMISRWEKEHFKISIKTQNRIKNKFLLLKNQAKNTIPIDITTRTTKTYGKNSCSLTYREIAEKVGCPKELVSIYLNGKLTHSSFGAKIDKLVARFSV